MLVAQTTSDLIASELRQDILRGKVAPGSAFRQEELARRFSVSRIPIREALRALERDGLVEVHPNRGAYVVELTPDQIQEVTDLRVLIEGDLIYRAVRLMSNADRESVKRALAASDALSTTAEWSDGDRLFHETLYRPAGRPQQLAIVVSLRRSIERYWAIYGQLPKQRGMWLSDHDAIGQACLDRKAKLARALLGDHIRRAGQFLIERLRAQVQVNTTKSNV